MAAQRGVVAAPLHVVEDVILGPLRLQLGRLALQGCRLVRLRPQPRLRIDRDDGEAARPAAIELAKLEDFLLFLRKFW